jgi:glutamate-1-semialdehyde 2,1-aminomutase
MAMSAGLCSLRLAARRDYGYLVELARRLARGLLEAAESHGIETCVNRSRSMLSLFFTRGPVVDLVSAQSSDVRHYASFFHRMLDQGVYLPPSQFETWMLSFAHDDADIDRVIQAADTAFANMAADAVSNVGSQK